jgi:hypothetical protein
VPAALLNFIRIVHHSFKGMTSFTARLKIVEPPAVIKQVKARDLELADLLSYVTWIPIFALVPLLLENSGNKEVLECS